MRKGLSDESTGERPAVEGVAESTRSVAREVIAVDAVTLDDEFVAVAEEPASQPVSGVGAVGGDAAAGEPAEDAAPESTMDDDAAAESAVDGDAVAEESVAVAESASDDDDPAEEPVADVADVAEAAVVEAAVVEADRSIAEVVYEADPVLLAAVDQARAALAEITPAESIGESIGHVVEGEHVLSLLFASTLSGYPDWHWTATLARASDHDEPTVLEVALLPGDDSILSPAWVPWADRVTPESLIDDSESEFDDDRDDESDDDESRDDDESGSDESDEYHDDSDDDDGDADDDGESDDDDDDDDEIGAQEAAALALHRDRDGIDIDTIAEEGLDIEGIDDDQRQRSARLIDTLDDAVELTEEELAEHPGTDSEVDRTY